MLPFRTTTPTPLFWSPVILLLLCRVPALAQSPPGPEPSRDASDVPPAPSTWKGAIVRLLIIEHTTRVAFQEKTRRELGGAFFQDYRRSLKIPNTWGDGDSWPVNYVGHPIHGAAAGFIWLDHEDGAMIPTSVFHASTGRAEHAQWHGRPITAFNSR